MVLIPNIPLGLSPDARAPEPLNLFDQNRGLADAALYPATFCGALPAELGAAARGVMRWRQTALEWCWIDRVPGITAEKQIEDTNWAFAQWSKATNGYLQFTPTSNSKACDILLTTARIDGSGRVLADMMLPPGDDRQLRGRFDTGEQWDRSIIFKLVLLHELGHAMGLDHITRAGVTAVLNPIYNPALLVLQPADIARVLEIYPEAVNFTPPPKPTDPPPTDPTKPTETVTINFPGLGTWQGPMKKIA